MEPSVDFLVALLSDISDIPVYEYNKEQRLINYFCIHQDTQEFPSYYDESMQSLLEHLANHTIESQKLPVYKELSDLPIGMFGCSLEGRTFIIGPVLYRKLEFNEERILNKFNQKEKKGYKPFVSSIRRLVSEVICLYSIINKETLEVEDIYQLIDECRNIKNKDKKLAKYSQRDPIMTISDESQILYRMQQADDNLTNHTYIEEEVIWKLIRKGDVQAIRDMVKSPMPKSPLIIDQNQLKNQEYMAVTTVTVISRVAIEAGVSSAESFRLSDLYLKSIANCTKVSELIQIGKQALIDFTKLVYEHQQREKTNPYVENCKREIEGRIFQKITLSQLATKLEVRATYLSRLFSEYEGITVMEYVHKEKIELSKNMLKYSGRTIAEIADYLHFGSQSYFGRIFKRQTGMTPKAFRNKYHARGF